MSDPDTYVDTTALLELAQEGKPDAQLELGIWYYLGDGVEESYSEAVRWFRKAAEQGYDTAAKFLSEMNAGTE